MLLYNYAPMLPMAFLRRRRSASSRLCVAGMRVEGACAGAGTGATAAVGWARTPESLPGGLSAEVAELLDVVDMPDADRAGLPCLAGVDAPPRGVAAPDPGGGASRSITSGRGARSGIRCTLSTQTARRCQRRRRVNWGQWDALTGVSSVETVFGATF